MFVDVITRTGEYLPAKTPVWIEAGLGKVVPFACQLTIMAMSARAADRIATLLG